MITQSWAGGQFGVFARLEAHFWGFWSYIALKFSYIAIARLPRKGAKARLPMFVQPPPVIGSLEAPMTEF